MNKSILAASVAAVLVGCGGGSVATDPTGIINVAITDAAVDDVSEVWVEFTEVALKPKQGNEIVVSFDPAKSINLLDLQNGKTEALLPDTEVPVGPYVWMRLAVNAQFADILRDNLSEALRAFSGRISWNPYPVDCCVQPGHRPPRQVRRKVQCLHTTSTCL